MVDGTGLGRSVRDLSRTKPAYGFPESKIIPVLTNRYGEVTEWLMVPVLKTGVGRLTEGSNPSLSAK